MTAATVQAVIPSPKIVGLKVDKIIQVWKKTDGSLKAC
jgi:hypothetical protein